MLYSISLFLQQGKRREKQVTSSSAGLLECIVFIWSLFLYKSGRSYTLRATILYEVSTPRAWSQNIYH